MTQPHQTTTAMTAVATALQKMMSLNLQMAKHLHLNKFNLFHTRQMNILNLQPKQNLLNLLHLMISRTLLNQTLLSLILKTSQNCHQNQKHLRGNENTKFLYRCRKPKQSGMTKLCPLNLIYFSF